MEAINRVTEAESAAEETIQRARADARELVNAAREQAAHIREDAVNRAREEAQHLTAEAEEQGRRETQDALAEAEARCAALQKQAESNMGAAVGLIVERVVKS